MGNGASVTVDESLRKPIIARDHGKCRCCGSRKSLEVHHIISREDGGESTERNLITLCTKCHDDVELGKIRWPDYANGIREREVRIVRKANAKKDGRRLEMYRLCGTIFVLLGERYE